MPRQKAARSTRISEPTKLQDNTGLDERIRTTIIGEFVAPLEVRVEQLEATLKGVVERGVIQTATIGLARGRRGGVAYIEPDAGFSDDAIGKPALVTQGPVGDAAEGGIILFTGEVIDQRRLRVHWFSAFPAPARMPVLYLIA